jgi:hypothetical protein
MTQGAQNKKCHICKVGKLYYEESKDISSDYRPVKFQVYCTNCNHFAASYYNIGEAVAHYSILGKTTQTQEEKESVTIPRKHLYKLIILARRQLEGEALVLAEKRQYFKRRELLDNISYEELANLQNLQIVKDCYSALWKPKPPTED